MKQAWAPSCRALLAVLLLCMLQVDVVHGAYYVKKMDGGNCESKRWRTIRDVGECMKADKEIGFSRDAGTRTSLRMYNDAKTEMGCYGQAKDGPNLEFGKKYGMTCDEKLPCICIVPDLLKPEASGVTSSQLFAAHLATNALLDDDGPCRWGGPRVGSTPQVALKQATKNFIQIDLEHEHNIDSVEGLDVATLVHQGIFNNFESGAADIYVCETAGSGLTAGDCSKCDGAVSNTGSFFYARACGGLLGRYVRVEFLASKGLNANIHFCRLRIYKSRFTNNHRDMLMEQRIADEIALEEEALEAEASDKASEEEQGDAACSAD